MEFIESFSIARALVQDGAPAQFRRRTIQNQQIK
jgi:hypothetical protein